MVVGEGARWTESSFVTKMEKISAHWYFVGKELTERERKVEIMKGRALCFIIKDYRWLRA